MENISEGKLSNRYKEIILDVFRVFISICEKYDLQYFCCGGTAIGVVRHQGMIPWDDDIDVLMPRDHYNKFIDLMKRDCPEGFELIDPKTFDHYYLPFAKFSNNRTTVLEHLNIPCVFGVNIDIFPLDGANSNRAILERDYQEFKLNANKLRAVAKTKKDNFNDFFNHLFKFQLRTALNEARFAFNKKESRAAIWRKIEHILMKHDLTSSNFVGNYGGMWGLKEFCPKDWFSKHVNEEFEAMEVKLPGEYDKLLTQMYGDYMTPPPIEKRQTHHHVAYVDLDKRLTISEIRNLLKQ